MLRQLLWGLWAVVLGLGVVAGLARASEPLPEGALPPPDPVVAPGPVSGYGLPPGPGPMELGPWPLHPVGQPYTIRHARWSQRPCGCWAHHNNPRCGSLGSELRFLFGSCRTFYGEPCLKLPPAVPLPYPVPWLPVEPPAQVSAVGGYSRR